MAAKEKKRVLIVEDTTSIAALYRAILEREGFQIFVAPNGDAALKALQTDFFGAVVLDLGLPDMSGLDILNHVIAQALPTNVIVVTTNGSIKTAVEAMRLGAYDFVVKPIGSDRLVTTVGNAVGHSDLKVDLDVMRDNFSRATFCGFIGESFPMQSVYSTIEAAASSDATVFITGESGVGKELAAEAIHQLSRRKASPFVAINCGAIPRELIASELFGHLKGSFTGAIADRAGAVKQANGGTLFLDEICEMQLDLQPELLRFLQTGTYRPVGATRTEKADLRVVCATNREPLTEIAAGRFREDLYYRLYVVPLELPPLRDREGDIVKIAAQFLARFSEQEQRKAAPQLSPQAKDKLLAYNWPGNVRQLQNIIRNALVMNDGKIIEDHMLLIPGTVARAAARPSDSRSNALAEIVVTERAVVEAGGIEASGRATIDPQQWRTPADIAPLSEIEETAIERALELCQGNIPRAAAFLGVSPSTIYRKRKGQG